MGAGPDDEVPIVSTELYHSDFDAFVKVRARSLPSRSICQLVPSRSLPGDRLARGSHFSRAGES